MPTKRPAPQATRRLEQVFSQMPAQIESKPLGLFEVLERQASALNEQDKLIAELVIALEKVLPPSHTLEGKIGQIVSFSESSATAFARNNLETLEQRNDALCTLIHRTNAI